MRFEGKLDKWNDDRGFGFITPARGGEPVFVHISAFPRDGSRPRLGEPLTFEVEPAGDGKKRATKVERPGDRRRPGQRQDAQAVREPRRPKPRRSLAGIAVAVALVGVGGYSYKLFSDTRSDSAPSVSGATAYPAATQSPAPAAFQCDGRTRCSQMTSCDEAKFFLRNCPGTQMDGDGDGIPCEQQWCTGGARGR